MPKNKIIFICFLLLGVLLSSILLPQAYAYDIPITNPNALKGTICPGNFPNPQEGLTSRLIPCIRDSITYATTPLLLAMEEAFDDATFAAFTIAVIVLGFKVTTGYGSTITRDGVILAIKIAGILMFCDQFNHLYPVLLNCMESMLNIMAHPAISALVQGGVWNKAPAFNCTFGTFQDSERDIMEVWNVLDCYINLLIGGIFSNVNLASGIVGIILAAMVSSTMGMFIAFAGLYVLATGFMTIARLVYIFLSAYLAFSFMVLISAIFIPMILFKTTKGYFDRWLQLTISFLIQPIFVMGYLIMFLVAINTTIFYGKHSLYYAIAGEASMNAPANSAGFEIGKWVYENGGYADQLLATDQPRVSKAPKDGVNDSLDPTYQQDTAVQDMQGKRAVNATPIDDLMGGGEKALHYFQAGLPFPAIDWDRLAEKANMDAYLDLALEPSDPSSVSSAIDQFHLMYKIGVFLSFITVAIVMYIFYSLLEYMPYIGTSSLGEPGIMPLGVGNLAPPGNNLLGKTR